MSNEDFESLVVKALNSIPDFFREKLDNVDVVIEDWPLVPPKDGQILLGLYQGVPATSRGHNYTLAMPDKITIFKGPIELVARGNADEVRRVVIDTVEHEIAHHFGISDKRLKELKK